MAALSNNAFKYFVWESFKKRLDASRYSLIIILIDTLGLYKISYVADFKITWNILSNLNKLKLSPKFLSNSSTIISSRSIVPKTISLINFLNLCLGNSI